MHFCLVSNICKSIHQFHFGSQWFAFNSNSLFHVCSVPLASGLLVFPPVGGLATLTGNQEEWCCWTSKIDLFNILDLMHDGGYPGFYNRRGLIFPTIMISVQIRKAIQKALCVIETILISHSCFSSSIWILNMTLIFGIDKNFSNLLLIDSQTLQKIQGWITFTE